MGLSLIFGTTGLVNFSHGEHVTWGAVVAWWINRDHDVPLVWAAVLAIGIGVLTGALVDRLLWKPLRNRGVSLIAMMIVSIGFSLAARSLIQLFFGGSTEAYGDYNVQKGVDIGPITAAPKDFWTIGIILIVIVGVASMLQFSRVGKAMRAVSDNPDLAASSGIDVDRVILVVWAMGGGLAATGGVLLGDPTAGAVRDGLPPAAADVRRHHPRRARHGLRRAGRVGRRRASSSRCRRSSSPPSSRTSVRWPC